MGKVIEMTPQPDLTHGCVYCYGATIIEAERNLRDGRQILDTDHNFICPDEFYHVTAESIRRVK